MISYLIYILNLKSQGFNASHQILGLTIVTISYSGLSTKTSVMSLSL